MMVLHTATRYIWHSCALIICTRQMMVLHTATRYIWHSCALIICSRQMMVLSTTRWATQLGGGDVYYGDRSRADQMLLTYTSEPLAGDMEITGSAVISLEISSTHEDGAFIVYLEDLAPDGYVRMLAEGQLRAIHRAVSAAPTHATFGPFHSFASNDGQPMAPGEITTLSFALLPVSALVREGHAIRVAIAGHDKDTFIRVPETGDPVIQVYRQQGNASWIDLPVMRKE